MKTQKKQSKKAVTLLARIEKLLADTVTEGAAIEKSLEKNFRELLHTAEVAVAAAKEFITPGEAAPVHHRAAVRKHVRPPARHAKRAAARGKRRTVARAA